jgi:hypothetical protein
MNFRTTATFACWCALAAAQRPEKLPTAAEVVVRGTKTLDAALLLATSGPAPKANAAATATLVFDATPSVVAAKPRLIAALRALDTRPTSASRWRAAVLGKPPGPVKERPSELAADLERLLAQPAPPTNDTLGALRASLETGTPPGVVVYVADTAFEDDSGAETLADLLRSRGVRFNVVGPEAAFGRAWYDARFNVVAVDRGGGVGRPGAGRAPFGPQDPQAPWRGGDTAYPHLPPYWNNLGVPNWPWPDGFSTGIIPSSFGSYPLSRVAVATGGRYVLWGWTASASNDGPVYDDAQCDRFAPDLRPRAVIAEDAQRRPLARALNAAWRAVAGERASFAYVTPPFDDRGPARLERIPWRGVLRTCFNEKYVRDDFVAAAHEVGRALAEEERLLAAALKQGPARRDAVDRRYAADIDLLRYALLLHRFTLGEAALVAQEIGDDGWDGTELPGVGSLILVPAKSAPPRAGLPKPPAPKLGRPRDEALFAEVLAAREALLKNYAGTPYAEIVLRAPVYSGARTVCGTNVAPKGPREQSKSSKKNTDATPKGGDKPARPSTPGSSGAGGGTTGGGGG